MPSRDFTSEDLFSSRMMSMQSSTHSSQMNTVGPAISLRTSCWLLPQNGQDSGLWDRRLQPFPILSPPRRSITRSTHSGTKPDLKVDRANTVPKKTLTQIHTVRITAWSNPAILPDPHSQPC